MMQLIHTSPLGALEIPGVPGYVEPGTPFDVDDDIGENLLEQTDLYKHASPLDQLRAEANRLGIDTTGMKKAQIQAALAAGTESTEDAE